MNTQGVNCPYRISGTFNCRSHLEQYEYCQKTGKSKTALLIHTIDAPMELKKYEEEELKKYKEELKEELK